MPNLVIDLNITHNRHGRSTSNPHTNGHLTHPDSLDRPLEIAARAKIIKHQAAYSNNNSTSFMPGVASTSGRLHCELLRLLLIQAHRETEKYCRLFGVPAQTNQDSFRYKRAAFYSAIKGKVGLIFAKAAALRININTDGSPVAMGRTHINTSHIHRTLLTSSPPPFRITSSLPALVIKCPGGLLIPSPSALALRSTLLLFLSFTLSIRYSSLFQL